jgi:hypothetical protein
MPARKIVTVVVGLCAFVAGCGFDPGAANGKDPADESAEREQLSCAD